MHGGTGAFGFIAWDDHSEFVDEFLRAWRADRDAGLTTGAVIDALMTAADCYLEHRSGESPWQIDGEQLRVEAQAALDTLSPR
jgi:hypothetical protein